jgi:hypothetical protein
MPFVEIYHEPCKQFPHAGRKSLSAGAGEEMKMGIHERPRIDRHRAGLV